MSNQWENALTGEVLDEFGNVIDQDDKKIELFNLGKVKAQLARYGVKSEIMHTGGGCATLYLGDPNAEGFYPVVCGAGIYDPENPDNSEGFADEFFIGRDDDRQAQGFYYKGANDPVKIADQIFNYFMFGYENRPMCENCDQFPTANDESEICTNCGANEALDYVDEIEKMGLN